MNQEENWQGEDQTGAQESAGQQTKFRDALSRWLASVREKQQEEPEPGEEPETEPAEGLMRSWGNHLARLRQEVLGAGEEAGEEQVSFRSFLLDGNEPSVEQKRFLNDLQSKAAQLMSEIARAREAQNPEPVPVDAAVEARTSANGMEAWAFLFPPLGGGADVGAAQIREKLQEKGVVYGLDEIAIDQLAARRAYFKLAVVARGELPQNGKNGRIIDIVPRKEKLAVLDSGSDTVDFKELNWLRRISEGDVICEIVPPTPPVDGRTVTGRALKGRQGKKAFVPNGQNTALTEDGARVVASIDGQISFYGDRFNVVRVIKVDGNVDNSTGNLNVLGDVAIEGDVLDGFTIKATGNVVIRGMVAGANVTAGGSIQIGRGMNGNSRGSLTAQGDIRSKYLENCSIRTDGCVYSESIINCQVVSNDRVVVTSGRGVIVCGSIAAFHGVEANVIGNQFNRTTSFILGTTQAYMTEKNEAEKEIGELLQEMGDTEKNVSFLERAGTLTPEYQTLYNQLKLRLSVLKMQLGRKKKHLEELEVLSDFRSSTLKAGIIYPLTQITIGGNTRVISAPVRQCNVYYGEEGVTIGMK